MDVLAHNRAAWDREVAGGDNPWTRPVGPEVIAAARRGDWSVVLTEQKPVPRTWFPPLQDADVLCLASGGGQQGPVLAAAGARVTVLDASAAQLAQDRLVAQREGLPLRLEQGDMADLSRFADASFDLVFHPVSNCFAREVTVVWREVARVLRPGGVLLAGFLNPDMFVFDLDAADRGELLPRHALPYSDLTHLPPQQLEQKIAADQPLEFSQTMADQIGGQLAAGLEITGFYEDRHRDFAPARLMPTYFATRAVKPLAPVQARRGG
jgi:SAM-dependent methyltransferase